MTIRVARLFASWREVKEADWRWENFTPEEMACRHCGEILVAPVFMDRLQAMRAKLGFPFLVSSGYRCPSYNAKVSTTGRSGPHTTGRAADLAIFGIETALLITAAPGFGFSGRGLLQHGSWARRFVHLDDLESTPRCPRPRIWTYNAKEK